MNGLGLPLFILSVAAMCHAVYATIKRIPGYGYSVLFFTVVLPIYLITGRWNYVDMRFIIPMTPLIAVLTGIYVSQSLGSLQGRQRQWFKLFAAVVMIYSVLYIFVADAKFAGDSRYPAAQWLKENLKPGETIEAYGRYNPPLPDGIKVYTPPVEGIIESPKENETQAFDAYLNALGTRNPDYIVLSSFYYDRYLVDPIPFHARTEYFSDLLEEKGDYKIVYHSAISPEQAEGASGFGTLEPVSGRIWRSASLGPSLELVDPALFILGRKTGVLPPKA